MERRYDEREIAAIFEQATQAQETARQQLPQGEGLTLAELQQIGRETGITPEFIARAAAALDRAGPAQPTRTFLGVPLSVGHSVELPGPLTDEAWDRLVVELRETFHARGQVRRDGSLREWRNGNLHALLEPSASGYRLRLGTFKESGYNGLLGGLMACAFGLVFLTIVALTRGIALEPEFLLLGLFVVGGLGAAGMTAARLPAWAAERKRQMEAIAERAVDLASVGSAASVPEPDAAPRLDLDTQADPADAGVEPARRRRTRA